MFPSYSLLAILRQDPVGLDRAELRRFIVGADELRRCADALEIAGMQALADLPPDPSDPAKDVADTVARDQSSSPSRAKRRAKTAEQLRDLSKTQEALGRGRISGEHADALAAARADADASARDALDRYESDLLDAAARESVFDFRKRLAEFVRRHSTDDGLTDRERKRAASAVRCWAGRDGMTHIAGALDPEWGRSVRTHLERRSEQLYRRDHRDPEGPVPAAERTNQHRMAEALVDTCRRDDGRSPAGTSHDRVVVTMTKDDLVGVEHDGPGPTMNDGTPVPASAARRMACTAGIIPVVLGGDSIPLDLGRTRRRSSPHQRIALGLQWGTCSFADCTMPFEWTEIHHTNPFNEGRGDGKTNLDELAPACDHCHDLAHTPGWSFVKNQDGSTTTTAPDGRTWHREPNRRPARPQHAAAPDPASGAADTLFTHAA